MKKERTLDALPHAIWTIRVPPMHSDMNGASEFILLRGTGQGERQRFRSLRNLKIFMMRIPEQCSSKDER